MTGLADLAIRPQFMIRRQHHHDLVLPARTTNMGRNYGDFGKPVAIEVADDEIVDRVRGATIAVGGVQNRRTCGISAGQRREHARATGVESLKVVLIVAVHVLRVGQSVGIGVFPLAEEDGDAGVVPHVRRTDRDILVAVAIEIAHGQRFPCDGAIEIDAVWTIGQRIEAETTKAIAKLHD